MVELPLSRSLSLFVTAHGITSHSGLSLCCRDVTTLAMFFPQRNRIRAHTGLAAEQQQQVLSWKDRVEHREPASVWKGYPAVVMGHAMCTAVATPSHRTKAELTRATREASVSLVPLWAPTSGQAFIVPGRNYLNGPRAKHFVVKWLGGMQLIFEFIHIEGTLVEEPWYSRHTFISPLI